MTFFKPYIISNDDTIKKKNNNEKLFCISLYCIIWCTWYTLRLFMSHRISTCSAEAFALTLPFSLGHEITVVAPRYYSYKYCKLHIWATFSIVFQHKPDRYLFKGKPIARPHYLQLYFLDSGFQAVFRFASLFIYIFIFISSSSIF